MIHGRLSAPFAILLTAGLAFAGTGYMTTHREYYNAQDEYCIEICVIFWDSDESNLWWTSTGVNLSDSQGAPRPLTGWKGPAPESPTNVTQNNPPFEIYEIADGIAIKYCWHKCFESKPDPGSYLTLYISFTDWNGQPLTVAATQHVT